MCATLRLGTPAGTMNFSVQNNSLPRLVVVSQWLFETIGGPSSFDMYYFSASPPK
jgi:hypothetical protein